MSSSTNKKVVVYRFDREPILGFVNPQAWLQAASLEILTPSGALVALPLNEVKVVCFVRDFDGSRWNNERKSFVSRPKSEGLWVLAVFRDNDSIEGLLPNDLLHGEAQGYLVAPPDAFSNTQKLFLPRAALREFRVKGVIGTPRRVKHTGPVREQISLFE